MYANQASLSPTTSTIYGFVIVMRQLKLRPPPVIEVYNVLYKWTWQKELVY